MIRKENDKALPILFLFLIFGNSFYAFAQRDSTEIFESGKSVFNTYCSPCHGIHQEIIGPMLANITKKRPEDWLVSFIRNSQQVILSDDAYADFLYEQYNQTVMPAFRKLPEAKIKDILFYIEKESINPTGDIVSFPEAERIYKGSTVSQGKELFMAQCASCHFIERQGLGPALGSVPNRRPREWLISFIQNSQKLIKANDSYAIYLFNSFNQQVMPPFNFLNQEKITAILDYINYASVSPPAAAGVNGGVLQPKISVSHQSAISPYSGIENKERGESSFKILLIIISSLGAVVHVFIVARLFMYLSKKG